MYQERALVETGMSRFQWKYVLLALLGAQIIFLIILYIIEQGLYLTHFDNLLKLFTSWLALAEMVGLCANMGYLFYLIATEQEYESFWSALLHLLIYFGMDMFQLLMASDRMVRDYLYAALDAVTTCGVVIMFCTTFCMRQMGYSPERLRHERKQMRLYQRGRRMGFGGSMGYGGAGAGAYGGGGLGYGGGGGYGGPDTFGYNRGGYNQGGGGGYGGGFGTRNDDYYRRDF